MSSKFETYLIQQHFRPQDVTEIASIVLQNFLISDLAKLSLEEFYTLTSSCINGKITQYVTWLACKEYHNNALTTTPTTSNTVTTTSTNITLKKSHFAPYTNITNPIRVIDVEKIHSDSDYVKYLEFSHNGKFLYVSVSNTIEIWSIPDCQRQFTNLPIEFGFQYSGITISPQDDVLACILRGASFVNSIVIWNMNTNTTKKKLHKRCVLTNIRYNTSGSALGFTGIGSVGVHDVTHDEFPLLLLIEEQYISTWDLCFVPMLKQAGEYFLYAAFDEVICINVDSPFATAAAAQERHANQQLWKYTSREQAKIAFSVRYGLFIFSLGYFTHLNVENGQVIREIRDLNFKPYNVSIYESFIVVGGRDGSIEIRNIPEMTLINRWYHIELNGRVTVVCFHPSGRWVVSSGSSNSQIKLWSE
jgi:WD40 repeat protein